MGKDTNKYTYITIALTKGSRAEQRFLQDAEEHHMADNPGKLGALRLTEYYELKEELKTLGMIAPSLSASARGASNEPPRPTNRGGEPGGSPPRQKVPETATSPDVVRLQTEQAEANAEDAGDYWSPL